MATTDINDRPQYTEDSRPRITRGMSRDDAASIACEVAARLGATQAEALSVLRARLSDTKTWLNVAGNDDARIWLVIVRAPVGIPRLDGQVLRAERIEVAIDDVTARPLGFRLVG